MSIDRIRGTRNQSHQILPLLNFQRIDLRWQNRQNLIYFICQCFMHDFDKEDIAHLQLIQICKQLRRRQPPMPGQDTVRRVSSNRKGRISYMPNSTLQDPLFCSMIDRKSHADLWNLQIPHHPVSIQIQCIQIRFILCLCPVGKWIFDSI